MLALALQTVAAFNLMCTGTIRSPADTPARPYSKTYRIDLDLGRWCMEPCTQTTPIARITDETITLDQIETPNMQGFMSVSRESGNLISANRGDRDFTWYIQAHCERAPFTGFPQRRF